MQIKRLITYRGKKRISFQRCQRRTLDSSGTGEFNDSREQCGKYAVFMVDGIYLCSLHAGEKALHYLMKRNENDRQN